MAYAGVRDNRRIGVGLLIVAALSLGLILTSGSDAGSRADGATADAPRAVAVAGVAAAAVQTADPGPTMTMSGSMAPGSAVTVDAQGYRPGANVELMVDGNVVGSAVADPNGKVRISMTVPMDMAPGAHMMALRGLAIAGQVMTVSDQVTVVAAAVSATPAPMNPAFTG